MPLAGQQMHQRCVHPGPLVLGTNPLNSPTPTADRDRTVSRRSEPSSRTALMGEQPNPWEQLHPQDATSRHRGAKPGRRCGLLGPISLLSPEYLLSVERRHFHLLPPRHSDLLSHLLGLSVSVSSSLTAFPLYTRFRTVMREPLCAPFTFWEATAPVKLPAWNCPAPGFTARC